MKDDYQEPSYELVVLSDGDVVCASNVDSGDTFAEFPGAGVGL